MIRLAVEHEIIDREVAILRHQRLYSASFNDQWHRTVDISKARRLLSYAPGVGLDEGLLQVLRFHRHPEGLQR